VADVPISVPSSMVPVCSIVTWAWMGTSRPTACMARRAAMIDALRASRSKWVSVTSTSTPPSIRPRIISS
jgi:hypothetical protein